MQVQKLREPTGWDIRKSADDPYHEALGTGHAQMSGHALGRAVQRVIQLPYDPHELKHVAKCRSTGAISF
jgi:hypothetical protein